MIKTFAVPSRPWTLGLACVFLVACGGAAVTAPGSANTRAERGGAGASSTAEAKFRLRDFKLKSGLRIIVEEERAAPIAGVVSVVGVGSANDPPGKEGLAHLVEHLTFRAT